MSTIARPVVFADVLPQVKARSAALVATAVGVTALLAQVKVGLGFTPVPITGQTFGALLAGAALGWRLGSLSMLLYVVAGLFLPFYAGGESGWEVFTGATGGYLVGMIAAAAIIGKLAERMADRDFLTSIPAMLFGSAIIYLVGVPWLAAVAGLGAQDAIEKGLAPFVIGDGIKVLLAGVALPVAWKLSRRNDDAKS